MTHTHKNKMDEAAVWIRGRDLFKSGEMSQIISKMCAVTTFSKVMTLKAGEFSCCYGQLHPDQRARPVWAVPEFDKLSQAWLLALPSPSTDLPVPVLREAMAAHLCLPSPCCKYRVGQPLGDTSGALVDPFGDAVHNVCPAPL